MKKYLVFLLIFSFLMFPVFSSDSSDDSDETEETAVTETSEETTSSTSSSSSKKKSSSSSSSSFSSSSSSSSLSISGSFTGKFGLKTCYEDDEWNVGEYLELSNTLSMTAKPIDDFSIHGSFKVSYDDDSDTKFQTSVSTLYFKTFLFDQLTLLVGKTSSSSSDLSVKLECPWKYGKISGTVYGTLFDGSDWRDVKYKTSAYIKISDFKLNSYVKASPKVNSKTNELSYITLTSGLEYTDVILGFDTEADIEVVTKDSLDEITFTGNLSRSWTSFKPNISLEAEYEYVYTPNPSKGEVMHSHSLVVDLSISKIELSQNIKCGLDWEHDVLKNKGSLEASFGISDLFPKGSLSSSVKVKYTGLDMTQFKTSLGLSFSAKY